MKRIGLSGLLALALAAPLAVMAEDDSAKAKLLAEEFNVSQSQLMDIKTNQNLGWDEIKTSLMISQHSGASLDEVVRLKLSGLSFEDIATRYNLKLEDIEKMHVEKGKRDETIREAPAQTPRRVHRKAQRLADDYEVSSDEIMRLHDRGLSWKEVRQALFIAEQSGRPLDEIVGLKESGMDFDDIAERYDVNLKDEPKRKPKEKKRSDEMREAPSPVHKGTGAEPQPESVPQGTDPGVQPDTQRTAPQIDEPRPDQGKAPQSSPPL